jgi:hypothetical protein
MKKQTNKKRAIKRIYKPKKKMASPLTLGNIDPAHGRILMLIISIIFVTTAMTMRQAVDKEALKQAVVAPTQVTKPTALATQIKQMVQGYPIEQMTPYILKQNPKTAMFLIAIAKKESAWGKRHPVLDGQDCYNYWGFRLKTDKMGSGGHTCFNSPQEAVEVVGSRISQLVNEEKIDTPKKMIVWKCGYGCDGPEAAGSDKWIKDVDYYYNKMIN